MTALQQLNALAYQCKAAKNPSVPAQCIPKSKYNDRHANGLTTPVIACIELYGGYAVRINTQGRYNEELGQWTKSQTRKGTADVHGILNGQHLSIEIKVGKDRLSDDQHRTAYDVEKAGGRYYFARDFGTFWQWFTALQTKGGEEV